ncbi:hypothetical protein NP493_103g02058 [Ridgeia piscesae]|uniref:Uncharacterized protein n=1 Tax=Ridgeia piscesae TaxID=27915 RepID=A0AAD9P7M6_RIDPI|nr:hypothetical protein NP493_103g02058 [Ridgeia piscesae]
MCVTSLKQHRRRLIKSSTPAPDKIKNLSLIVGGGAVAFIVLLIIIVAIIANRRSSTNQRSRNDSATTSARPRSQRPPEAKTESGERVFQINLAFDHVNADGDRVVVADGNNMYSMPPSNTPTPNR